MPFLDVPTMLLMTAAASLTMAASLGAVRPGRREGISLWALGLMMHTSTYVLYALRGLVSDWASIVLANTLLSGTFAMVLAAVHQFQGRALPWRRMAVPVAATALLFAFFIDDYRARIVRAWGRRCSWAWCCGPCGASGRLRPCAARRCSAWAW